MTHDTSVTVWHMVWRASRLPSVKPKLRCLSSAWRGQVLGRSLFEVGGWKQAVTKGSPWSFGAQESEGVKGQHLCPKPTGDAKQKLAWSQVLNCSMGTCCSDALLNFQGAVFHWGWNMGENRVFQVTKNEQSNSFTGSWVARKVYLIMGRKPEHSPRYQGRINPINKTKHELEKKY